MKKKLTLVIGMLLCSVLLFTACGGGAPGFVSNPPEDPDELVTKLKDDGWEASKSTSYNGLLKLVAAVNGMKTNIDMEKFAADYIAGTIKEDDKIEMETALVLYFEDEATADANYETSKKDTEDGVKTLKDAGLTVTTSVTKKGKTVSNYAKVSGTIKQYMDAVSGAMGE